MSDYIEYIYYLVDGLTGKAMQQMFVNHVASQTKTTSCLVTWGIMAPHVMHVSTHSMICVISDPKAEQKYLVIILVY